MARLESAEALLREGGSDPELVEQHAAARLDCGACHRARIRATRWLALAMTGDCEYC
jgi:hypothetical protein